MLDEAPAQQHPQPVHQNRRHTLRHSPKTTITHALIIKEEPLSKILAGTKTWEIRGSATTRRGRIALVQSKSGLVVGTCELVDVVGPLGLDELRSASRRSGFTPDRLPYASTHAWVMRNARRLRTPIPYAHPAGAVIWVKLSPRVVRRLAS
jgi:hypothetical protein